MINDLKVRAYDLLALIERAQADLHKVNNLIIEEINKQVTEAKKEDPKKEEPNGSN